MEAWQDVGWGVEWWVDIPAVAVLAAAWDARYLQTHEVARAAAGEPATLAWAPMAMRATPAPPGTRR